MQEEKKSFPTTCIPQHGINKNFKNSNIVVSDQNCLEQSSDFSIVISNATAKWTDTQTDNSLENVNLIVRSGRLVAIIGHVGAGKVNFKVILKIKLSVYLTISLISEFVGTSDFR